MSEKKKFLIFDGSALLHRAFHALPPLTTPEGKVVNAVYGFTSILIKILKEMAPKYVAVTFDLAAPTFRHKEFKEYKAQRIRQPQELYDQIPLIYDVLEAFKIPVFSKEGFEADDVIATLCDRVEKADKDIENIILTGDLDALQLVNEQTKVLSFLRGISETILYDRDKIMERFGLKPEQMIDYKAFRGDPSDNIPGVRGIGEVTAKDLILKFGSVEDVYKNLKSEQIRQKTREILEKSKETAEESKRLVTLVRDVPIDFDLEKVEFKKYDLEKISEVFNKFGFQSLLKRIFGEGGGLPQVNISENGEAQKKTLEIKIIALKTAEEAKKIAEHIKKTKVLFFKTSGALEGVRYFENKAQSIYLNVSEKIYKIDLKLERARDEISALFSNKEILKVGYDIKKEICYLENAGVIFNGPMFDIFVASYLLFPGQRDYSLASIILSELNKDAVLYAENEAGHLGFFPDLYGVLSEKIKKDGLSDVAQKIEMPLLEILAEMERTGIILDIKFLKKMSGEVKGSITKLENEIYKKAGQKFNLNSPKQLKTILFDKLRLNERLRLRKTKTGISTAAGELLKMKGLHSIVDLILDYREMFKLYSTYINSLPKLVDSKTKRLHAQFNQTIAATGRLSSSEPNLQNIPIRSALGEKIRKAFVADKNFTLLSADYSQIELRVVAHLANDKKMLEAFNCREDIHTHTAAEIFNVAEKKVTPEMRRLAKTVNFGVLYGMGPRLLAEKTGRTMEEAKMFIEQYFVVFKGIAGYLEETKALARSLGYVETLFGRRRYLPEINSGIEQVRAAAERMAINHPVQGTAADLIKLAMIEIGKEIESRGWEKSVKMLLQVHDELVFEVASGSSPFERGREIPLNPPLIKGEIEGDFVKQAASMIKEAMENVAKLRVPLEVEISAGKSWGELKKLNK